MRGGAALALALLPGMGGLACQCSKQPPSYEGEFHTASGPVSFEVAGTLELERIASGLRRPVDLVPVPHTTDTFLILEQAGRARVLSAGHLRKELFLDMSDRMPELFPYSEQGLLSIAFHPDWPDDPRIFVHYTEKDDTLVLAEMQTVAGELRADPKTEHVLFRTPQEADIHNGGRLAFGADGMLYASYGEGGPGDGPDWHPQDRSDIKGSILRLDVSTPGKAAPASGNPFIDEPGVRGEIWLYGLRNAWRFSFDTQTNDLYVADVGDVTWEEVTYVPAGTSGQNLGWSVVEGYECRYDPACDTHALTPPAVVYSHEAGCAVTGGTVYRGQLLPAAARGQYFFSDYCEPWLRSFEIQDGQPTHFRRWTLQPAKLEAISAIATDGVGELYLVDHRRGQVWKISGG